ncbi:MAG: hypothetical protein NXI19_06130 [Alphaproteobacteria bacterium]|nr:hypothetical protein [Alphaproteobacteria bacterium]
MTTHRYERGAIIKDYLMGGAGLAVVGLPLVVTELGSWMLPLFTGLALLFGVYLVRTWIRSQTVIEVDDVGLRAHGPRAVHLPWEDLAEIDLRYFSTRRDKFGGWMQLKIGDGSRSLSRRLSIESSLQDFPEVALRAGEAAERNDLTMSETTIDNLRALARTGIPMPEVNLEPGLKSMSSRDRPGSDGGGF